MSTKEQIARAIEQENADAMTATKAAHTPGPWEAAAEATPCVNTRSAFYWVKGCSLTVAGVLNGSGRAEANLRLIAAAPDLLAACQELVADLLNHASYGLNEHEVAMLRRAEAAIKKATT